MTNDICCCLSLERHEFKLLLCNCVCSQILLFQSRKHIQMYMKSDKKQFVIYSLFGTLLKSATTKAASIVHFIYVVYENMDYVLRYVVQLALE